MTEEEEKPEKRVLSIAIKDKSVLYATYMQFLKQGGLFIPTQKLYRMGEKISLLITLMDEAEKFPVSGTVIWITPKGAQGNRAPGVGLQFEDHEGKILRGKIETYLAGMDETGDPTHTM